MYAEMGTEARRQLDHYAQVKTRLYGSAKPVAVAKLSEPKKLIVWDLPEPDPTPGHHTAPVNMIGLCSWRFLVAVSAEKNGCKAKDILGYSRVRNIAKARHEAVYLIAAHTNHSIAQIARLMNRDHTSTMASLRKFPKLKRKTHVHANIRYRQGENE